MRKTVLVALLLLFALPIFSLPNNVQLTKKITGVTVHADYSYSIMQKEELTGCSDERVSKEFGIKNNGNVPNVYSIRAGDKALRIALMPKDEQTFLLPHYLGEAKETILTITPMRGKEKEYALAWEIGQCNNVHISIPEEITSCAGEEATLEYELLNNGSTTEEILLDFAPISANESVLLEPGERANKTITFMPDGNKMFVSYAIHNKPTGKISVSINILPECSQLIAEEALFKDEKWFVHVVNKGIKAATYAFEIPDNGILLETKTLLLEANEEKEIAIVANITHSKDIVILAHSDNRTQVIHAYLDMQKPLVQWNSIDRYAPMLGITILIPLLFAIMVFFIVARIREYGGIRLKTYLSPVSYDSIDFDNLLDENETYHHIFPKRRIPRHLYLFVAGALLLAIGSAGMFSSYPDEAILIVFGVGVIVAAVAILITGLWFSGKRLRRWHMKQQLSGKKSLKWITIGVILVILSMGILIASWNSKEIYSFSSISSLLKNDYTDNVTSMNYTSFSAVIGNALNSAMNATKSLQLLFNAPSKITTQQESNESNTTNEYKTVVQAGKIHGAPVIFIPATLIAFLLLVSIGRKGWISWQKMRRQKREIQHITELATKIHQVERKTRLLKKEFSRKKMWDQIVDYFFEEV